MKSRRHFIGIVPGVVLGALGAIVVPALPFDRQWPIFEGLQVTAGIAFGVAGAWLAIIYPDTLGKLLKPREVGNSAAFTRLIEPMWYSAVILACIVFFRASAQIAPEFAWLATHRDILLKFTLGVALLLSWLQAWTLLLLLAPSGGIAADFGMLERRQQAIARARTQVRMVSQDETNDPAPVAAAR